jgi:hypothetical protein
MFPPLRVAADLADMGCIIPSANKPALERSLSDDL